MGLRRAGKGHLGIGENWKRGSRTFRSKLLAAGELEWGLDAIWRKSLGLRRAGKEAL